MALAAGGLLFCGIVLGGVVTSTESGLVDKQGFGFSGGVLPNIGEMLENPGLLVEHGHRMIMWSVGFLTLAIAALAFGRKDLAPATRRLAIALPFLMLPPATLGILTVNYELHPAFSIVHVTVAMLTISAIVTVAVVTGPRWLGETARLTKERVAGFSGMALTATLFIYFQIILGAVPRHATAEQGGSAMVMIGNIVHIIWAFAVVTIAVMLVGRVIGKHSKIERLLRPSAGLFFLLIVQVVLGFATFVSQPKEPAAVVAEHEGLVASGGHETLASFHQGIGVLILLTSLLLTLRIYRICHLSRAESGAGEAEAPA